MSIEISSKTENISTQRDKNSILLTEILFHSSGRGRISEDDTPSQITDFRSSTLGLSNKVSFDFLFY